MLPTCAGHGSQGKKALVQSPRGLGAGGRAKGSPALATPAKPLGLPAAQPSLQSLCGRSHRTSIMLPILLPPKPPKRSATFSMARPNMPCRRGRKAGAEPRSPSHDETMRHRVQPAQARRPEGRVARDPHTHDRICPPSFARAAAAARSHPWWSAVKPARCRPAAAAAAAAAVPPAAGWWRPRWAAPCQHHRACPRRCAAAPATRTSQPHPRPARQSGGGSSPLTWPGSEGAERGDARRFKAAAENEQRRQAGRNPRVCGHDAMARPQRLCSDPLCKGCLAAPAF